MSQKSEACYAVPRLCDLPGASLLPKDLQIDYTREIVWNITNACNMNCPHCYSDAKDKAPDEVTTEQAKKIMDKLVAHAQSKGEKYCICWAGGEPLMREDFFELMAYAKSIGLVQHVVTNGTLITDEVAQKLKENGMKFTCFSIDSFNPETHDRLKGKGSQEKALNAIETCFKAGIYQVPLCVMSKNNFDELKSFREECVKRFGVEPYFDRLVNIGRAKKKNCFEKYGLTEEQFKEVYEWRFSKIKEYIDKGEATKIPVMELFDLVPFMYKPQNDMDLLYLSWGVGCQAGRFWLGVNYNGDVWPCFRLPYKLGNLLEQSLQEIEDTDLFKAIRDRTGKKGKCAVCEHVSLCGGGCLSDTFGLTGDPFEEYPYCWYEPEAAAKEKKDKEEKVA